MLEEGATVVGNRTEYFAGLVDGEGSICIVNSGEGNSFHLCLSLGMIHEPTIATFCLYFGGEYHQVDHGGNFPMFYAKAYNERAYEILKRLQPFAITKSKQIELALHFWEEYQRLRRVEPRSQIGSTTYEERFKFSLACSQLMSKLNGGGRRGARNKN